MEHMHMFKVSKRTNGICLGLAITALVAIFCYQTAYGTTIGADGTMTTTQGNTTATITAPPGTTVGPVTITPLNYTHLNGTWSFVYEGKNTKYMQDGTSGNITFGTEPVRCDWCSADERQYGFNGTINGEPVEGTYIYIVGGVGTLAFTYTFHHHEVDIFGDLNETTTSADHIDITYLSIAGTGGQESNIIHGATIHLMKDD
jgi:hypothetical protein